MVKLYKKIMCVHVDERERERKMCDVKRKRVRSEINSKCILVICTETLFLYHLAFP